MKVSPLNRRQALFVAGGGIVAACTAPQPAARAQSTAGKCVLMPRSTQGPFYVDPRLERADIRDGRPGTPLLLRLNVADAASCKPAEGARVDIWHCDARGAYSAFGGQPGGVDVSGETFLRGHQLTDPSGSVAFRTIWPGWYDGRAPHIHFKILLGDTQVLTAQIYFPDALNEKIYTSDPAYRTGWSDEARNDSDGIFLEVGGAGLASVSQSGGTMVASLDVGIGPRSRG